MPSLPFHLPNNPPGAAPALALAGVVTLIATLVHVAQLPEPPAGAHQASTGTRAVPQSPAADAARNWESIPAWHVFGEFDAAAALAALDTGAATAASDEQGGAAAIAGDATPPADPDSLADTRLNLTLNGVLHAATTQARAIISVQGSGDQQSFAVGDEILPNVEVHAIAARQVVIVNAGVFEAVRLPQPEHLDQHPRPGTTARGRTAPAGVSSLARND